jgi:hypothetical protein
MSFAPGPVPGTIPPLLATKDADAGKLVNATSSSGSRNRRDFEQRFTATSQKGAGIYRRNITPEAR